MTTPPPDLARARRRAVGRAVVDALGGQVRPRVPRMWDAADRSSVDVMVCEDRPDPGLTTCSTVDLHETTNLLGDRDIRVELIGVCRSDQPVFLNVLATAALSVINDATLAAPDVVHDHAFTAYDDTLQVKHLLLGDPFPFEALGRVVVDPGLTVHWLLALPLTDAERELALAQGVPALTDALTAADAAFYDLDRASVV